nr:ATP synthase F0 subunit 8 [Haemaphysalis flava]
MPQIFPMNWLLISLIIMTVTIVIMVMTFFVIAMNKNKMNFFKIPKKKMIFFKW